MPVSTDLPTVHRMAEAPRTFGDAIAANVRAERARNKWSQAELGERLGWSGATVSDLEVGRRTITANDLPLLCQVFEITLVELAQRARPDDLRALGLT